MLFVSFSSPVGSSDLSKSRVFYGGDNLTVKNVPNNIKRIMSSTYVVVVRIGGNNGEKLVMSKPCSDCIKYMCAMGVKKVYYSDLHGNMVMEKLNHMHSTHVTMIRRLIRSYRNK